jgi:hypothetical protein
MMSSDIDLVRLLLRRGRARIIYQLAKGDIHVASPPLTADFRTRLPFPRPLDELLDFFGPVRQHTELEVTTAVARAGLAIT